MSKVGVKIDQFKVPVCNVFEAKILNNQVCYEANLDKLKDSVSMEKDLQLGFYFLMDYNEDRQLTLSSNVSKPKDLTMARSILEFEEDQQSFIYLSTIGKFIYHLGTL